LSAFEIANLIEMFITDSNDLGPWEWDDFISSRHRSPDLEKLRIQILEIERLYPGKGEMWCSDVGFEKLKVIAKRLKSSQTDN
jgi:hypothetical protein